MVGIDCEAYTLAFPIPRRRWKKSDPARLSEQLLVLVSKVVPKGYVPLGFPTRDIALPET
jgi:hypothetical protein